MKLLTLVMLTLAHLSGPGLAEAPVRTPATEVRELRRQVRQAEALRIYAINHGWKVDLRGRVWR